MMKSNAFAIVLVIICVVLGVVLFEQNKKHTVETQDRDATIVSYSNNVTSLDSKLKEQVVVNATLETNLAVTQLKESNDLADLAALQASLASTSNSLDKAQADARAAAAAADAAIAEKDKKITALESQNTELDKQSIDLRGAITNLEGQIQSTQKKLAASEGDKKLLMEELKRLQAQKEELEKKFADLAVLKEQVRKLKDELSISRRLDWIRRGLADAIGMKGGERLIHPLQSAPPATNASLDVELHQNGGAQIKRPPGSTNAPMLDDVVHPVHPVEPAPR